VIHAPGISIRPDGPARAFLLARYAELALRETGRTSRQVMDQVARHAAHVVPVLAAQPSPMSPLVTDPSLWTVAH